MIVVCGEALIDVIRGADGAQRTVPGGGPFNTARALARLGVPAAFLGHLSDDAMGRRLRDLLAGDGASLELASVGHEKTTTAVAEVDTAGRAEYRFLVEGTAAPNLTEAMLPERLPADVTAIHVGSLGMVLEPMASTLESFVNRERHGRLLMLDPNVRPGIVPDDRYRARLRAMAANSTIVKGSEADLEWLYGGAGFRGTAGRLLDAGVSMVVVTLGARGAFGALGTHGVMVPSAPVEVIDTIGAGDAFGAGLLAWLHERGAIAPRLELDRSEVRAALEYACLVAALTCTKAGADPPWRWELERARER